MNRPKSTTQILQNNSPLNCNTDSKSRICSPSEHQLTDSGFESLEYSKGRKVKAKSLSSVAASHRSSADAKTIPFDMSFVCGIFSFKLYHFEVRFNFIRQEIRLITQFLIHPQHNEESRTNNDSDTEPANKRRPLFSATLFQPNVLISQSVLEKTTQLSLFNLNFKLGSELSMDKDTLSEFDDVLFETRAGDLSLFGIPPPLIQFREHILSTGERNIDLHIKRPMLVRFSSRTLDKMLAIRKVLEQFTASTDYQRQCIAPVPITTSNKIKIIQNYVLGAHQMNLSVAQTDVDCSCPGEYSLKFGLTKFCGRMEFSDHPQRLSFRANVYSLVVNTGRFIMINPLTLDVTGSLTKENWKRTPLVALNVQSTCIDVSIGPENIVNLLRARDAFSECLERANADLIADAERWLQRDEQLLGCEGVMHIPMPKGSKIRAVATEEHYQDDLR